jgi:hypothetical protein
LVIPTSLQYRGFTDVVISKETEERGEYRASDPVALPVQTHTSRGRGCFLFQPRLEDAFGHEPELSSHGRSPSDFGPSSSSSSSSGSDIFGRTWDGGGAALAKNSMARRFRSKRRWMAAT